MEVEDEALAPAEIDVPAPEGVVGRPPTAAVGARASGGGACDTGANAGAPVVPAATLQAL